jgi:hypothetical protein
MVNQTYMNNRVQYARPQAMLWSDTPGTLDNGFYVPDGYEKDSSGSEIALSNFIIISDHNRSPIDIRTNRIERRERMINGRMRSYHIADKLTIDVSWDMLPSRAFNRNPDFNSDGTLGTSVLANTVDGGAGGEEMLDWYESHTGPFWVFLAYDRYRNFGTDDEAYTHLGQYNEIIEMYLTNFDYSIETRGGTNFDLWNVRVTLEEA